MPDGFDADPRRVVRPSAFTATPAVTYGTCGYNTLRGPGSKSMNLSACSAAIALGGERRLELRVETFNLFNWVNYGFPAANVSNLGRSAASRARSAIRARFSWPSSSTSDDVIVPLRNGAVAARGRCARRLRATARSASTPQDAGAAGTWQALQKLHTTASVMHTTAHPDDEHGGVIARLSRGTARGWRC